MVDDDRNCHVVPLSVTNMCAFFVTCLGVCLSVTNLFAFVGRPADVGAENGPLEAEFSSQVPGVALYWQDTFWGDMGPDVAPHRVNTCEY
jgi:hypothetical protein